MTVTFKTVCSVCNAPQFKNENGTFCINGHADAAGKLMTFSSPMTKKERQWIDRNAPKCDCGAVIGLSQQEHGIRRCSRCERDTEEKKEAARTVNVSREDLQALLNDAGNTYHYLNFPEHALRIRAALDE
jgi:hypothetical protein